MAYLLENRGDEKKYAIKKLKGGGGIKVIQCFSAIKTFMLRYPA